MTGKTYIMTAPLIDGSIIFKFNLKGYLISLETPQLTEKQYQWIFNHYPAKVDVIERYKQVKNVKVQEVPEDLSFERFWEDYGYKVGKKKQAENMWNKLSKLEKIQALLYIPKYKTHLLKTGHAQAYPTSFINQRYFDC